MGQALTVVETFFAVPVADMGRAVQFYVDALGATVAFGTPGWTSIHIAGVRIGLYPGPAGGHGGLHFAVADLGEARSAIAAAGGRADADPVEVAPGVVIAEAADTEGNGFTLRGP